MYIVRVFLFWVIVWCENIFLGEVVIEKEIKLVYVFMNKKINYFKIILILIEVKLISVIVRYRIK